NRVGIALANLRAFDKKLAYADPYPPGRSPAGRILVIGPHGQYDEVQRRLSGSVEFTLLAYDAIINSYDADTLLRSYWHVTQQVKFASLLYMHNVQAMATVAGVPLNATQAAANPFFRLLARIELLTHGGGGACHPDTCHGTPSNYNNLMQHLLGAVPDWAGRPTFAARQQEAMRRVTEAWDATDTGVWFMLAFPECDHAHAPAGCGGK
ncbi:MAG TPA: hypothetical protein VFT36_12830, partial [Methylomirabilota bacterium]|nr:hypothetical protein [Methylomirabilota bacterium]